jgi:anti-sigma-K factor RskA
MSTDLHTLSGAYAIDALSAEEAQLFDQHLQECQACRDEVRELRAAAARMGTAEAIVPPAALKARVLAAADKQSQLPPKVTPLESVRRRPWATRLGVAAAGLAVVAGSAVGVAQLRGDDEPSIAAGVTQVFEAKDHHEASVATEYGEVRVATSPSRNEMAVDARGLEPLEGGKVYQVWSIRGTEQKPVAAIAGDVKGASMEMPGEGTTVAITIEPTADQPRPTTEPIVTVDPRAV